MPRILVTGGRGFVGQSCVPNLVAGDWEVHCVELEERDWTDGAVWHKADLLDKSSVSSIVQDISATHLLHLAWVTTPGAYWNSAENLDWVEASIGLLKAFQSAGGRRVVIAGSCAEYDWSKGVCDEFTTPLRPSTVYGQCKHALQAFAHAFCHAHRISFAWPRLFYLYGAHSHPQRFPVPIINAMLRGEAAPCSHGKQIRDYLNIQDAGSALAAILKSDIEGTINVASGFPIPLSKMLLKIADQLGGRNLLRWGEVPTPETEPPVLVADTQRLKEELGWRPVITLDEGLAKTIAWWKQRNKM